MWFRSLADFLKPRRSKDAARHRRRRPKTSSLQLEALEDRWLPAFLAPVNYAVGNGPLAIVTADLNNDGKLDLISANSGDNTISVEMGNGDGTFQNAQSYATGSGPESVAVGDFNGDGHLDVVTANTGDNTVSVLLGNGDGTFQNAVSYAVGSQPVSVAVGNFDGKLDIVTANEGDGTVSLLPGNGNGTFGAAQSVASLGASAQSVAVGDFNADGKLDLAVTTRGTPGYWAGGYYTGYYYVPGTPATVAVLLGNGNGTFTSGNANDLPSYGVDSVTVGDVNADGKLDLVTTATDSTSVSELLGNGDGTFGAANAIASLAAPGDSVAMGDFNADGKLDLAVTTFGTPSFEYCGYYGCYYSPAIPATVAVLLGNGSGGFTSAGSYSLPSDTAAAITAGDFNNDGFPDVAAANASANNVSVLLNTGSWPSLQVTATDAGGTAITSTTAGTSFDITVTARDSGGNVITGFTATVDFSTSDPQATIIDPATGTPVPLAGFTYTFTAADQGTHTFAVDLKTAGNQSVTVSDPADATSSSASITVNPAAASTIVVSGFPSIITAGTAGTFSVTARDPYGNVATGYSGTIHFSSSDAKASLPADTTLSQGTGVFSATLKTAGTQSISATDGTLTGTDAGIIVNPAAASQFIISAPASVTAGVAFSITVTVEDAYGNVVTGYTGTIHFTSSDSTAKLPRNYTFTAADKGVHTFSGLVLRKSGTQTITITDTLNSSLTDSVNIDVIAKRKK
jgi:VCBS repeat protein